MRFKNVFLKGFLVFFAAFSAGCAGSGTRMHNDETCIVNLKKAGFAGGCFWCIQKRLTELEGVVSAVSGYTGGSHFEPSYEQVASGDTGHREAVLVTYDPEKISYDKLLEIFWTSIDPLDEGGQFADRGFQYTSAIFYEDSGQKEAARRSIEYIENRLGGRVHTALEELGEFYPAEEYHQEFYRKNPVRYKVYSAASGRERRLRELWPAGFSGGKETSSAQEVPADEEILTKLTELQYKVTRKGGTEPAFRNKYWDNKEEGIYVDIVSGEPLFSSLDKYESGTGWPSFTRPIEEKRLIEKQDNKLSYPRTEVKSLRSDSHLGHVFSDGPHPGGLRYCINSAALRFISLEDLEKEGYGEYLELFRK